MKYVRPPGILAMKNEGARRLDAVLVEKGIAGAREKAKELIAAGHVRVNGRPALKPAQPVAPGDSVTCDADRPRYVGRGGLKLEKALAVSGCSPRGKIAMDVGASTGGFTDCLLQNGAEKVFAVDVGHNQLHASLRTDPRVVSLEGIDIRKSEKIRTFIAERSVLFCTIDVSFISVKAIFPAVLSSLADGAVLVCLIKPQFEAGRQDVGKKGVVRDPAVHRRVLRDMCSFFSQQHCRIVCLDFSPVTGGDGNIEYLAVLLYHSEEADRGQLVETEIVVSQAHAAFKKERQKGLAKDSYGSAKGGVF